jgi:putative endonuclease
MFYVYILHSKKDGQLYTGFANNLKIRIKKHNDGFVRATKHRRPLYLIYYEAYLYESDAKRREKYLKGGNGKENLKIQLKDYFLKNEWKTNASL